MVSMCVGLAALCLAVALIRGWPSGNIRVFECVAYIPAAAVIIPAAMLQMLADLPGRCYWPAAGQWDDQDARQLPALVGLRCGAGCYIDTRPRLGNH